MDEFYMTQQISKPFGENTYKDFSKTIGNFNPYNTFKSQDTNFTTFQKTNNINNFLKDKNIYNIIKLQYTIVSNYLSKMDLSHSLQTFNNEIKLIFNPATPFTSEEMSKIIDIENNENNDDFIKTNNSLIGNNTYLYKLINSKSNIFKENKGIQTLNLKESYINDNNDKSLLSLESTNIRCNPNLYEDINEKLKNIDKKYENKFSNNDNILPKKNNLEAKFNRYKKELDEKYREDLNKEIERIKTMEVSKVIIEQNQKYLEKIEKIRDEYENKYELKYKELTEKQKNLKEKENKLQMDYIETTKELISNYQKKLENFYKKEDAFNQKCIKELNEIKEQKNELDKKDKELFNLKKDYHKELQKEIDKLKSEFKTIYKEQLQKIYNEKEQEIEKLKNELNISKMANKLDSSLKLNKNKANEQCLKGLTEIKEKLKIIKSENKEKKTELNKRILPSSDLEEEKVKIDIDYYKKISELESQFNSITNKYKYKHFDDNIFKNISYKSDLVIKDDNIKKKLTELENMENEFNTKLEKELKEFIEDIPQVDLSKNEVDRIKENNYQLAVANIEKEKQLFEIYQKEKEEEDLINKIKYMNIINQNMINKQDDLNKDKYIIIDQNEMENHKKMYLKLYREKREQQLIEENRKREELIKNMEFFEVIKKEKQPKGKEKESKSKEKRDEEKSQYSKSIALPPVKNPKEKKLLESAQADEIEELIHKSKIRIAESKEKKQFIDRIKLSNNSQEEDEYGSGDFYDFSNEEKKSIAKHELTNKSNRVLSSNTKENFSDSYNDFETTKALNKQGILSETSEKNKSNEDFKF